MKSDQNAGRLKHNQDVREWVDAQGLRCPMPLLKAKQGLGRCEVGERIGVVATDAGAMRDIPAFCNMSGHIVHVCEQDNQGYRFVIEKGAPQA